MVKINQPEMMNTIYLLISLFWGVLIFLFKPKRVVVLAPSAATLLIIMGLLILNKFKKGEELGIFLFYLLVVTTLYFLINEKN